MIKKVLIANRGEIAVRIIRSCRELGIKTVAVYSEADRRAMHVRYADEAICIGPSESRQSYLNGPGIIEAAKTRGADAIHPGYGFLSENAGFASLCKQEGINFIGPDAETMLVMGNKISARKKMMEAGVPVVPGSLHKTGNDDEIKSEVEKIGLPVIIKAASGGGGKGMRLVKTMDQLIESVKMAQSEAQASFGDDTVYIEKYIDSPHHIEFQIMADGFGNVEHLFERECSIQRRHQKMIEETPSPFLTPDLREKMGNIAVMAAKAVNYKGAGTIEFLVDSNRDFYFLEMNTRLQVEHPVTERTTGIDLVKEQIMVASGFPLSFKKEDLIQFGHAIECRISAEDPDKGFMPSPGKIMHISEPNGLGVRTDGYVYEGYEVPVYYDPMLTKLIAWGRTRDEAIARMKRALFEYKITGIKTGIKFLERIMDHPTFKSGVYDTFFIEKFSDELLLPNHEEPQIYRDMAIIASYFDYLAKLENHAMGDFTIAKQDQKWKKYGMQKNLTRI